MKTVKRFGKFILIPMVSILGLFALAACRDSDFSPPDNQTYSIAYALNGGTNAANNPATYTVGGAAITLSAPTRTGYTFAGWTPNNGVIAAGSTGDKTFIANWTINTYSVIYALNGGTNAANNPATYTVDSAAITLSAPTRTGYTFAGWTPNNGVIAAGSTGDKAFIANWTANAAQTYSVTYALNGGTNAANNPATYTVGGAAITLSAPTRTGYTFAGWTPNNGVIAAGSTGDKTFTANWTANTYYVAYGKNHVGAVGDMTASSHAYDTAKNLTANVFTRTGYTFVAWNTKPDGTGANYADGQSVLNLTQTNGATVTLYAQWNPAANSDGFEYTIQFGAATITGYKGAAPESVVVPEYIGGAPVRTAGVENIPIFGGDSGVAIKTLIVPDGITRIGKGAFKGCDNLTEITLSFAGSTLNGTSGAHFGYIFGAADGFGAGGNSSSYVPASLEKVTITRGAIGNHAFRNCVGIRDIAIMSGVTSIGAGAFSGCGGLTGITVPDSVTSIGNGAFSGCGGLTAITVDNGNATYKSEENCIMRKSDNELIAGCKTSVIPSYVTSIGNSAFSGCGELQSITLPSGLTSIGGSAFGGCAGLTGVTVPDSVTSIGTGAFSGCGGLTDITIGSGVTSMGYGVFYNCGELQNVTMSGGLTSIGDSAFFGCGKLTGITLPSGITSIGEWAFEDCVGLTGITLPSGLTSIGNFAFLGCVGLTSVTVPDSVTSIGIYAFGDCVGLTSVTIGSGLTSIGDYAFYDCSCIRSITLPNGVTSIGDYAFFYWTESQTIRIQGRSSAPSGWSSYWDSYCAAQIVWNA